MFGQTCRGMGPDQSSGWALESCAPSFTRSRWGVDGSPKEPTKPLVYGAKTAEIFASDVVESKLSRVTMRKARTSQKKKKIHVVLRPRRMLLLVCLSMVVRNMIEESGFRKILFVVTVTLHSI